MAFIEPMHRNKPNITYLLMILWRCDMAFIEPMHRNKPNIIYLLNDIVKQVDPGVECSLYVDDFVIMYKSPTIDAIQRKLQHTINRLEKWTLKNGFTISKNKTVAMHFCPDKKCMDPVLKLDNDPIQFVKEAKFLGLIWDTKLTFEPHIKYLKARCQKSLNILKVLSRTAPQSVVTLS